MLSIPPNEIAFGVIVGLQVVVEIFHTNGQVEHVEVLLAVEEQALLLL